MDPYQIEEFLSVVTFPITVEFGATKLAFFKSGICEEDGTQRRDLLSI